MTTTTTTTVTHHEVIFGADEADRQTYTDHGDGSFISRTAEARATSFFLGLAAEGVRCGFYTNGVLVAGQDVCADELTDADFGEQPTYEAAPAVEHKTRCYSEEVITGDGKDERGGRIVYCGSLYTARCRCGWSTTADFIDVARLAARNHRAKFAAVAA